jgi:hypothetical protein
MDYGGVVLIAGGVATATLAADVAGRAGWDSRVVIALAALGAGLLVGFVLWETRVTEPLLDLRIFRLREFDVLLFGGSVGNIAYVSMVLLITMELQQVRGLSPLAAGCVFLAASLGAVVAGQASGRLAVFPVSVVLSAALAVASLGLLSLARAPSVPVFLMAFLITGFGVGLAWSFPSVAAQGLVSPDKAGAVSGTVLTVLVGLGGFFVAATASVVDAQTAGGMPLSDAIGRTLTALAAMAAVGAVVTAVLGRPRRRV